MQDPNEDTEWNEQLRKFGILPERPESPTKKIEEAFEAALEKQHANRLEGKSLTELDEIDEDGLEDEEFVQQYRHKRMAEIQQQAARERFGEIVQITKSEYKDEITETSKNWPVFVHISSSQSLQSRLLHALLLRVAPRYKDIKFVEIDCSQINERFPFSQCPTIIIYKDGNVVFQQVTLSAFGGDSANLQDVDDILKRSRIVLESDPRLLENRDEDSEDDNA